MSLGSKRLESMDVPLLALSERHIPTGMTNFSRIEMETGNE